MTAIVTDSHKRGWQEVARAAFEAARDCRRNEPARPLRGDETWLTETIWLRE